ncbi:MAG TPA: DUF4416 family protein [Patescibacteria group bacterium]|nr:DUF4416 family protein [Patescibacteria group bacterium]
MNHARGRKKTIGVDGMSTRSDFKKAKYFCGLIFSQSRAAAAALEMLREFLPTVDSRSAVIPFTVTDYYREEMGEPLFRQFVSFKELLAPEQLPEIKMGTNELEERLAAGGKRTVNIDPGYLSDANVIIATAKNHYHRVPLRDGIYAHIEYVLKDGRINFLPWTYPDFQSEAYLDFFRRLQERFKLAKKGR